MGRFINLYCVSSNMALKNTSEKRYIYIMFCIGCKHDWVYRGIDKKLIQCPICKKRKPMKQMILRKINITNIILEAEHKLIDRICDAPNVI